MNMPTVTAAPKWPARRRLAISSGPMLQTPASYSAGNRVSRGWPGLVAAKWWRLVDVT